MENYGYILIDNEFWFSWSYDKPIENMKNNIIIKTKEALRIVNGDIKRITIKKFNTKEEFLKEAKQIW